jgi:hypothetical protein
MMEVYYRKYSRSRSRSDGDRESSRPQEGVVEGGVPLLGTSMCARSETGPLAPPQVKPLDFSKLRASQSPSMSAAAAAPERLSGTAVAHGPVRVPKHSLSRAISSSSLPSENDTESGVGESQRSVTALAVGWAGERGRSTSASPDPAPSILSAPTAPRLPSRRVDGTIDGRSTNNILPWVRSVGHAIKRMGDQVSQIKHDRFRVLYLVAQGLVLGGALSSVCCGLVVLCSRASC